MARTALKRPNPRSETDLLGLLGPVGTHVAGVFALMDIAEEEMARAGQPRGMFMALLPPEGMSRLAPEVYRSHCRELLQRHKEGDSLEEATDAELLCALAEGSLRAPLNTTGTAAYLRLGRRVLVDARGRSLLPDVLQEDVPREPWEGAVDELLAGLRRRLRVPTRRAEPTRATTLEAFA